MKNSKEGSDDFWSGIVKFLVLFVFSPPPRCLPHPSLAPVLYTPKKFKIHAFDMCTTAEISWRIRSRPVVDVEGVEEPTNQPCRHPDTPYPTTNSRQENALVCTQRDPEVAVKEPLVSRVPTECDMVSMCLNQGEPDALFLCVHAVPYRALIPSSFPCTQTRGIRTESSASRSKSNEGTDSFQRPSSKRRTNVMSCANVVLRNATNAFEHRLAFMSGSLGDAIERYTGLVHRRGSQKRGSLDDILTNKAVHLLELDF